MGYPHDDVLKELRKVNRKRLLRWHPEGSIPWLGVDWSNAMQSEAGEAGNVVKKLRRIETKTKDADPSKQEDLVAHLAEEIADTIIYCDLLGDYYDINIREAIIEKFNKVSTDRGFPEKLHKHDFGL